jgi:antitoxin (DNA-binding transcriptional repressor) of toxin-antitoxin stability system
MAMEINAYAAKTHLSRLIDQVNAGEEVLITRYGRPVAPSISGGQAETHARVAQRQDLGVG